MSFRVGLTGGIASGKSTVSQLFSALGVTTIDADIIARQLLEKNTYCYQQVIQQFGAQVLLDNGDINRPALRDIVFDDINAKQALEKILHPQVRQQLLSEAENSESSYCLLIVPLLLEANMLDLVNRTLVVDTSEQIQLERLIQRDNLTNQQAQAMLNGQASRAERLQIADDIIENHGGPASLQQKVEALHHFYCELAVKYNASCE